MTRDGLRILDSDMHVFEPHDLYLNYMNSKWGDRIPRGEVREQREGEGLTLHGMTRYVLGDGSPIRTPGKLVEFHEQRQKDAYIRPASQNYNNLSQLEAMDEEGLDMAVQFRTSPLHTDEDFEPDYANDLCKAWNEWMHDFCSADPSRLKGSALITLHDVDLAVKEARRSVKELGAVGLSLCPEPINGRHIHDHDFDPLWAEAIDLNVPICFPSAGTAQPGPGIPPLRGPPQRGAAGQSLAQSRGVDPGRQRLLRRWRAGAVSQAAGGLSRGQL